ncbi:MAG TPA: hypothetical protein DCZ49_04525 [Hyphomonadaceae bacterium]|nr:hypothetical protein [Hyphomonadaceae bacterium]
MPGEILLEWVIDGAWMRCSAVCAATGREAQAIGPAAGAREALAQIAIAKLINAPRPRSAAMAPEPPPFPRGPIGLDLRA